MTRIGWLLGSLAAAGFLAGAAAAQDRNFGEIATDLTTQVTAFGNLAGVVGMLIGLAFIIMSMVKFRSYSTNPQDPSASLSGSVGWLVAGVALVALPELMGVGITSLFGDDGQAGNFENPLSSLGS